VSPASGKMHDVRFSFFCFDFICFSICNVHWKGSQRSIQLPLICAQDREEVAPILVSIAYGLWAEDVIAIQ
jgi:hypothetical protein